MRTAGFFLQIQYIRTLHPIPSFFPPLSIPLFLFLFPGENVSRIFQDFCESLVNEDSQKPE